MGGANLRYNTESFGNRVFDGATCDLAADLAAAGADIGASGCRVGLRLDTGAKKFTSNNVMLDVHEGKSSAG